MKKLLLPLFACCSLWAQADDAPLWLRYPALSPDGREIAFTYKGDIYTTYKGDIYTVPVEGGRAVQLTTNPRHDTRPVWSPDGRYIAFASDREGSFDVYLMAREGGTPRRLTTHSGNEYPETFKDNETILFTASIRPDVKDTSRREGQPVPLVPLPADLCGGHQGRTPRALLVADYAGTFAQP